MILELFFIRLDSKEISKNGEECGNASYFSDRLCGFLPINKQNSLQTLALQLKHK